MTADPDDDALLARARAGDVGAFAGLVHRHAPRVHAAARGAGEEAPDAVTTRTFVRAMRRLDEAPPDDLAGWLLDLQPPHRGREPGSGAPDDRIVPADEEPEALPQGTLDAIWTELAARWPSGRRPVRLPRWVAHVALVALLLGLSVAIPYLLLVTAAEQNDTAPPLADVVAEPLEEDDWPADPDDRLEPDR
ncbi:MAG: hypothetical protein ACNA8R_07490 [Nitriliruptoraceae bacterium]